MTTPTPLPPLPSNWKRIAQSPVPAAGVQPTGSNMFLEHLYLGRHHSAQAPAILNAKTIGPFPAVFQLVYTYTVDGQNHPGVRVYEAVIQLNAAAARQSGDPYRFSMVSLGQDGDFGHPDAATKDAYLNEWYLTSVANPGQRRFTLKALPTPPDWTSLAGHTLFQGQWAVFVWILKAPCIHWSLPSAGPSGHFSYFVLSNGTLTPLRDSCDPLPPPPPPPADVAIRYAELTGAGAAVFLLASFLLPVRYQRGTRFFAIVLAATAAALGIAATLPAKNNS